MGDTNTKKRNSTLRNQRGSALIMALFAISTLVIVAMNFMSRAKNNSAIANKIAVNTDIDQALSYINAILVSPANCNANFYLQPQTGTLTSIERCPTGFRCSGDANGVPFIAIGSTSWDPGINGISSKVRVKRVTYLMKTLPSVPTNTAGVAQLRIVFEKKLENSTIDIVRTTEVYVMLGGLLPLSIPPTIVITGCTRHPNTMVIY